jgi:ribonuclease R
LIEEFMILANVCAAETLEQKRAPCLYRVHDQPAPERIEALRVTLEHVGYRLARGQTMRASTLARILEWAADRPFRHMINELVLRTQALAVYSPGNLGHFGLALPRYAHFTSPIRRYADLVVHRSLVGALGLGPGALPPASDLVATGEHVSDTERRAAAAERDAMARYVAAYLSDRVGAVFPARVSGVERFGLFATLDGIGADGLIPMARMGGGWWRFEPERRRLVEPRSGRACALGDPIEVELLEANSLAGSLVFALRAGPEAPPRERPKPSGPARPPRRGGRKRRS